MVIRRIGKQEDEDRQSYGGIIDNISQSYGGSIYEKGGGEEQIHVQHWQVMDYCFETSYHCLIVLIHFLKYIHMIVTTKVRFVVLNIIVRSLQR